MSAQVALQPRVNALGMVLAAVALLALAACIGLWVAQALGASAATAGSLGSRGEAPAVTGSILYAAIPAVPSLIALIAALPVIGVLGRARQGARVPVRAVFATAVLAVLGIALVVACAAVSSHFANGSDEQFVAQLLGSTYSIASATSAVLALIALAAELGARFVTKSKAGR